jgi:hypothetical protein
MICPNCGHNVREGAKFCDECGIVLPASAPSAAPAAAPSAGDAGGVQETVPGMLPLDSGPGGRRNFAIIAGVLIFVLCCCCAGTAVVGWWLLNQPGT